MFPEERVTGIEPVTRSWKRLHVTATPHPQVGSYMGEEVVVVSPNAQRLAKDSNLRPTA